MLLLRQRYVQAHVHVQAHARARTCGPSHSSTRTSLALAATTPATTTTTTITANNPLPCSSALSSFPSPSPSYCPFLSSLQVLGCCQRGRSRWRQGGGSGLTSLTLVWAQFQRPRGGGRLRRAGRVPKLDAHLQVAGDQQGEQHGDRRNHGH